MVIPRLCTVEGSDLSLGDRAVEWVTDTFGSLLPWQAYALRRSLERRPDGRLRFRVVMVSVARQNGKTHLLRGATGWRLVDGPQVFGSGQVVLGTANRLDLAATTWDLVVDRLEDNDELRGRVRKVLRSYGRQRLVMSDGGAYVVQAANARAGHGLSVDLAVVDECWNVARDPVQDGILPTMRTRIDPQLWLVSTAGDESSHLMREWRARGMERIDDPESDVLLLEWSPPETADHDDPATWEWSNPALGPTVDHAAGHLIGVDTVKSERLTMSEGSFRRAVGNSWVTADDGWIRPTDWSSCQGRTRLPAADRVAVVESAVDGRDHALILAARDKRGRVVVRLHTFRKVSDVDAFLARTRPTRTLTSPFYENRLRWHVDDLVGRREMAFAVPTAFDLITSGRVVHDGDPVLAEQVLRARAYRTDSGWMLSAMRSGGPIHAVRSLAWALWDTERVQAERPRLYVAGNANRRKAPGGRTRPAR